MIKLHWEIVKKETSTDRSVQVIKRFKADSVDDAIVKLKAEKYCKNKNRNRLFNKKYYYVIEFDPG